MQTAEIHVSAAGIEIVNGPLVAGEPVPVAVDASAFALAEDAALTLVISSRAPNAPLSTAALERGDGDAWTGTLDTATRQTAVFFAAAAADEARPVVLELIDTAHRDSLFSLAATLRNSALIPSSAPCAVAPVYIPVPGKQGDPGDAGAAATVTVGATTTAPAGESASVTNVGTETDAVLNFRIPRGADGSVGFIVNFAPTASGIYVYVNPGEIIAFSTQDYPQFSRIEPVRNFPPGQICIIRVACPLNAGGARTFVIGSRSITVNPGESYNASLIKLSATGQLITFSETKY